MITTFMHLGVVSICMGVLSICGIHLWIWLPAVSSITIIIHLLIIHSHFKDLMEMLLTKYSAVFNDPEEIEIMKTSPGIFIPQVTLFTTFAKTDMSAALGWVIGLLIITIILGVIFKNYFVSSLGVVIFLIYLFSKIGSMFFNNNPKADAVCSVRRYLSKKKLNVKTMSDLELKPYILKYQLITEELHDLK